MTNVTYAQIEEGLLDAAQGGDREAFAELVAPYRRELQVHCYRMTASFEDSEDLVQETFLRAWRHRAGFEGRSTFRAWLYRIATNVALDSLKKRPRQLAPGDLDAEVTWLQPFPDTLLDEVESSVAEPGHAVVTRETIELAFIVAIQHLAPVQRAVFIMRDVLGWSARDTAELLDTTVAAANSALQRARGTMRMHLGEERSEWTAPELLSEELSILLRRYMDATDRGDADAIAAVLHEDLVFSMPPQPGTWVGKDEVVRGWVSGGFGTPEFGELRTVLAWANRQPAVVNYHRRPGDTRYRAFAIDVLEVRGGSVRRITAFDDTVVPELGLPSSL